MHHGFNFYSADLIFEYELAYGLVMYLKLKSVPKVCAPNLESLAISFDMIARVNILIHI